MPLHKQLAQMGFFLLIVTLFWGCEHAGPLEVNPTETAKLSDIQPLFDQNCALSGCHVGSNAIMGLDLSDGNSFQNLVGVASLGVPSLKLVEPNDPDNSYLIAKLEANDKMQPNSFQMPIGREPLSEENIQFIRDWIANGALDN